MITPAEDAASRIASFIKVHGALPSEEGLREIIDGCLTDYDHEHKLLRDRFMVAYKTATEKRDDWMQRYYDLRSRTTMMLGRLEDAADTMRQARYPWRHRECAALRLMGVEAEIKHANIILKQ